MHDIRTNARTTDSRGPRIATGLCIAAALAIAIGAARVGLTARSELQTLQADLSATRDELARAEQRTASLERQLQTAQRTQEQQFATLQRQSQTNRTGEKHDDRSTFRLTQDEVELIRSYIKASPIRTQPAPTINVGDELHNRVLLPLPAQIIGKAPRLAGGKFTIGRDGTIIISLRNSQVADAIIQSN
jgi:flagellar motility protein MotE (MotC chaperone)